MWAIPVGPRDRSNWQEMKSCESPLYFDSRGIEDRLRKRRLVEAAGIEPLFLTNPNAMMANDFGFCVMKASELPRRIESPGVLPSLGDILETVEASPKPLI